MARKATAVTVLERFLTALNEQDLELLLTCFHPEYRSEQPVHPERGFQGRARVAENWGWVFDRFDEFHAEVFDAITRDDQLWTEWRWVGIDENDDHVEVRGVMIFRLQDEQFVSGRLYMEPVDAHERDR